MAWFRKRKEEKLREEHRVLEEQSRLRRELEEKRAQADWEFQKAKLDLLAAADSRTRGRVSNAGLVPQSQLPSHKNRGTPRVWSAEHPVVRLDCIHDGDLFRSGHFFIQSEQGHSIEINVPANWKGWVQSVDVGAKFNIKLMTNQKYTGHQYAVMCVPFDEVEFNKFAELDKLADIDIEAAKAALESLTHE